MIHIQASPITNLAELRNALQSAIVLEHATIPPYLTAYYTLRGNSPGVSYARMRIRKIVNEEMLHMALACNILNAIGGVPQIAHTAFVPNYPDHLPMGIESSLVVHLKRYSRNLVEQTFMVIEEPEVPLEIPVKAALLSFAPQIRTIGQFYAAIRAEIVRQGNSIFTGSLGRQVTGALGASAVTDVDSAVTAINTIVEQGEGTPTSPAGAGGIAHYYRFEELFKGMKIVPDPASPVKFSFDPNQLVVIDDEIDVIPMVDDPQLLQLGGKAGQLADACDASYSSLLRSLQAVFDGAPGQLGDTIDQMREELGPAIQDVLAEPITSGLHQGQYGGPRFKYVA